MGVGHRGSLSFIHFYLRHQQLFICVGYDPPYLSVRIYLVDWNSFAVSFSVRRPVRTRADLSGATVGEALHAEVVIARIRLEPYVRKGDLHIPHWLGDLYEPLVPMGRAEDLS